MEREKHYRINSEKVVWRNIDGEAVILDLDSGYYYRLNPTGTAIWQMLEEYKKPEQIIKKLAQEYSLSEEKTEKDFFDLIADLKKDKLVN